MLRSWHLCTWTNTCHQWLVPWMRTHRRTSGACNESWRLLHWVLPTAGIDSHWTWRLLQSAPQGGTAVIHAMLYRQRGRKYPVSFLRRSPEPLPPSPHLSDAAVQLYSSGLLHMKSVSEWVEVAPTYFQAVRRVIFIIGTLHAISVTHCTWRNKCWTLERGKPA